MFFVFALLWLSVCVILYILTPMHIICILSNARKGLWLENKKSILFYSILQILI